MMWPLIRKLLFALPPETAHRITLSSLKALERFHLLGLYARTKPTLPIQTMGLTFKNRLGLAAGFDKNGEAISALFRLGFGFIEIGGVTLKPQTGNPKPRLFRLKLQQALINRMGLNNHGIDCLEHQLSKLKRPGILGVNLAKNKNTPIDLAALEYESLLTRLYPYIDYATINVSCPNTPDSQSLGDTQQIDSIMAHMKEKRMALEDCFGRRVPLVYKISPDLSQKQILAIAKSANFHEIDGLMATNTTTSRQSIMNDPLAQEAGGLSGRPLMDKSTQVLKLFKTALNPDITLIGCGGIHSAQDATLKQQAGADLIQIYTGLIYQGPRLIKDILDSQ
jgi:dihydroorotate dehydrogenase